jgi:hypothetical protein
MAEWSFRLVQEDEDEFHLTIVDPINVRRTIPIDTATAVELFEAVERGIGEYVYEMRREKAAFEAASAVERMQILGDRADPHHFDCTGWWNPEERRFDHDADCPIHGPYQPELKAL